MPQDDNRDAGRPGDPHHVRRPLTRLKVVVEGENHVRLAFGEHPLVADRPGALAVAVPVSRVPLVVDAAAVERPTGGESVGSACAAFDDDERLAGGDGPVVGFQRGGDHPVVGPVAVTADENPHVAQLYGVRSRCSLHQDAQ